MASWLAALSGCGADRLPPDAAQGAEDTGPATDAPDDTLDADPDAPEDPDAQIPEDADAPPEDALDDGDASGSSEPNDTEDPDAQPPEDASPDAPAPMVAVANNPVLGIDHPDPHVLRVERDGQVTYYLTATVHNGGDFPIYTSEDLVTWTRLRSTMLSRSRTPGGSIEINGAHFCALWAPDVAQVRDGVFMLSFSAQRFTLPQPTCPPYREDGGIYFASSASPTGPFALEERPWEPLLTGGHITDCPVATRQSIPRSLATTSRNCQGTWCHHIARLDSNAWRDPATGRWWLGYSWYTNDPPMVDWERGNHGEHVSLVELDANDPFTVRCDPNVAQLHIGNPHDDATVEALRQGCPRCGETLSFTKGRQGEELIFGGSSWGIAEGVGLFRRGGMVYALMSGSAWDSAYYHVYWVAAPTVEALALDSPERIAGRYLIPSQGQAFGHGTPVLGPDGQRWYYVHHRLDHGPCQQRGACARDVWVSPIEFEDRGDGRGEVWIKPRFPAEEPRTEVALE